MRPVLIALLCVLACMVCVPQAEAAGPIRNLLRAVAGKARAAAVAPLRAFGRVRARARGC